MEGRRSRRARKEINYAELNDVYLPPLGPGDQVGREAKTSLRITRSMKDDYIHQDYLAPRVRNNSRQYRPTDLETLKEEQVEEEREGDLVYTPRHHKPAGSDLETLEEEEEGEEQDPYSPDLVTLMEERGDQENSPVRVTDNHIVHPRDSPIESFQHSVDHLLLSHNTAVSGSSSDSSSNSSSDSSSQSSSPHTSPRALGNGGDGGTLVKCGDPQYDSCRDSADVKSGEGNMRSSESDDSTSPIEETAVVMFNPSNVMATGVAWPGP